MAARLRHAADAHHQACAFGHQLRCAVTAIGVGVHFGLRDLHYREAERRRAETAQGLAAEAIQRTAVITRSACPHDIAETKLIDAAASLLVQPPNLSARPDYAAQLLTPLCHDESLDTKLRAKAWVLTAKAEADMGDVVQSTRALERAAELDPECPVTIAALLHLESSPSDTLVAQADQSEHPVRRALLTPRSASGASDQAVRTVYRVSQTFFQVAIGRFYLRRGNLGLAFESLDRAVERDPASSIARLGMGLYWLARRERSADDEFRKDALATAHISLHMCILLEANRTTAIARRAVDAIAQSSAAARTRLQPS